MVRVEDASLLPGLRATVADSFHQYAPALDPIIKTMRIGPGRDAKIEARFSGPDPTTLRRLAEQAQALMRADVEAIDIRNDWRSPVKVVVPVFNEQVGRQLGISREDLADAMKYSYDGVVSGSYRDGNRTLLIKMRAADQERTDIDSLRDVQIWSAILGRTVPASAAISGYGTVFENALLRSRDRMQTIIASCNPTGELATPLFSRLKPQIGALELPPGKTPD